MNRFTNPKISSDIISYKQIMRQEIKKKHERQSMSDTWEEKKNDTTKNGENRH